MELFDNTDYWRKPERFESALRIVQSNQTDMLMRAANQLNTLDLGALANQAHLQKMDIKTFIRAKRLELLNSL